MPLQLLARVLIATLCCAGLHVSAFMMGKFARADRGALPEMSVVTSPRARIGGVPNAGIGFAYYALLLLSTPLLTRAHPLVLFCALGASMLAAATSVYLAYSLLFITRQPCAYCWAGHAINWLLAALIVALAAGPLS